MYFYEENYEEIINNIDTSLHHEQYTERSESFLRSVSDTAWYCTLDRIKTEHYEPAILEGIKQQNAELDAIIQNPEKATFTNTIEAYEQSGRLLDRVTAVFGNMLSAETNDDLQALAQKIMPLLSEHSNNITLNEKLFARVKEVYAQKNPCN